MRLLSQPAALVPGEHRGLHAPSKLGEWLKPPPECPPKGDTSIPATRSPHQPGSAGGLVKPDRQSEQAWGDPHGCRQGCRRSARSLGPAPASGSPSLKEQVPGPSRAQTLLLCSGRGPVGLFCMST